MTDSIQQAGPPPRSLSDEALSRLLGRQVFGTLATNKSSGHPHLTTMVYSWDPGERIVRMSSTEDRLKVRQLRRDPRAALHVSSEDHWSFAVAEGKAEVSGATTVVGDATGRELLAMLPPGARPQDPGSEEAFLARQVAERRVVIRLKVDRLYGTVLDVPAAADD